MVPRLASDLAVHCLESARGEPLSAVKFRDDACVTVVLASEGYPASPRTGDVIEGLDAAGDVARRHRVPRGHEPARRRRGRDRGRSGARRHRGRADARRGPRPGLRGGRAGSRGRAVQFRRDIAADAAAALRTAGVTRDRAYLPMDRFVVRFMFVMPWRAWPRDLDATRDEGAADAADGAALAGRRDQAGRRTTSGRSRRRRRWRARSSAWCRRRWRPQSRQRAPPPLLGLDGLPYVRPARP